MARITRTQGIETAFDYIFPVPVVATRAPTSSDIRYPLGQLWVRKDTAQAYILCQLASGAASWALSSPGASDVDTLTGDSGGAISPAAGNITLAGGTNITSAGAGSTITFNLDAAISLATSVTSPIYTTSAAAMNINSAANQNIVIKMGDAGGVNKVSFVDSASVEVAAIDSNGGFSMGAITFTGLLTASASATIETAGTALNLGSDNDSAAVNLGVGTTARAIGIGNSAAAHTITIGSTTGAASLALQYGTGHFTLNGAATGNITVGAAMTSGTLTIGGTAQTGTFTLGGSTGAMTMNIANANGAKTINIGAGVDGNTIAIGNGINTSAQTINLANGASAANTTLNIMSGVGTAGAGVIALGSNTRVTTIGIANIAPAAARTLTVCGGNGAQNDTFTLMGGNPSAGTQTINLLSGVPTGGTQVLNLLTQTGQAGTVNVGTGAAMANAINIGGTGANVVAIGNTQTGGSIAIGDALTSGTIAIGGSGANTGTITLAGGTGAQTLNIANSTGGKTVNIATGAGANAVTVGSTNTTSALTLQAGSGKITMTGTVQEINANYLFGAGTDLTISQSPILQSAANTGVAPTGTTGAVNLMYMQDGCLMEQFILGAGQTIIAPRMTANGLDISLDQTITEGAEYNFGARNNAKHAYTIGTTAAFEFSATIYVADISGAAPLMIGFRKVEANNATFANYTDYVGIGLNTVTSATNVTILSELNAGGQTATDTTDAWGGDAAAQTVKVKVSGAGVVTFEVGGVAATVAPAFTFDSGDVVMPYIRIEQGADLTGEVSLQAIKIGLQA